MPPKKAKAATGDEGEVDFDLNYAKATRMLSVTPNDDIMSISAASEGVLTQICTAAELGATGVRALFGAILGVSSKSEPPTPFTPLKVLRLWKPKCGDSAISNIADILNEKQSTVQLTFVELMNADVGVEACEAIGRSLSPPLNTALESLLLDYNETIAGAPLSLLVKGLVTNSTLKTLSLNYCGLSVPDVRSLQEVLTSRFSGLASLSLCGNRVLSEGMGILCRTLRRNTVLTSLALADNGIGSDEPEVHRSAMESARDMLRVNKVIEALDINFNDIGMEGAELIAEAFVDPDKNSTLQSLVVDAGLPTALFEKLQKSGGGGKAKKGGRKGKKGKKK